MSLSKEILIILAHQDDECFLSTRIERETGRGHRVRCVFLTEGRGDPGRREEESRRVLRRLGVPPDDVFFLGSRGPVPDGELHLHLEAGLEAVMARFASRRIDRIYTTAFEGGHQDHDAAHMIAVAFARHQGLLRRTWQVPLYNGFRTSWRLFRVLKPLPDPERRYGRRLPALEACRHAFLFLSYPSQWTSWLGLSPEFIIRRGLRRRETILPVDPNRLLGRPHEGRLLYERMRPCTYESFHDAARPFLEKHILRFDRYFGSGDNSRPLSWNGIAVVDEP